MKENAPDCSQRLELAVEAAREAGRITLEHFRRRDLVVERKSDDSPVTVADRRAEQHLRARITDAFPEDAVLGEEFPEQPGTSRFRWVLDPIDGTKSFIHGVPLYGTLVAVEHEGESIAGVILMPALDEMVYAARGQGAWYVSGEAAPSPASVSDCPRLAEGLFLTSEVASFESINRRDVFDRLQSAARLTRTWGDCYGYLMVATGRAEVMVDPVLNLWDAAALLPVVEEAGGTFTDWEGRSTAESGQAVATNRRVFDEVLPVVRP
ncbi:MAG: histidinol-phosphatase [Planctomycetota bacterium]|jgi:histidinol phosphatase-like enzyme (inositol monophosphatase family)